MVYKKIIQSFAIARILFRQVDQLRQRFINSTAVQGGMAGDRRDVVPASGLPFSAEKIWKDIKQNKDLDIPAHKVYYCSFVYFSIYILINVKLL